MAIFFGLTALLLGWCWWTMIRMPGSSHGTTLPPLTTHETEVRDRLTADVKHLAGDIGERNMLNMDAYRKASDWIEASLGDAGYPVKRETYMLGRDELRNIVAEIPDRCEVRDRGDRRALRLGAGDAGRRTTTASGTVAVILASCTVRSLGEEASSRTLRFVSVRQRGAALTSRITTWGALSTRRCCRGCGTRTWSPCSSLETMGSYCGRRAERRSTPAVRSTCSDP